MIKYFFSTARFRFINFFSLFWLGVKLFLTFLKLWGWLFKEFISEFKKSAQIMKNRNKLNAKLFQEINKKMSQDSTFSKEKVSVSTQKKYHSHFKQKSKSSTIASQKIPYPKRVELLNDLELKESINSLSYWEKKILILHFNHGKNFFEIASILNFHPKEVEKIFMNCLEKVKKS